MNLIKSLLFSDRAPQIAKRALDFNAQKTSLLSSNIANAETPGYKAVNLEFESVLKEASATDGIAMKATNKNHINPQNADIKSLQPNVVTDNSPGRIDGNNVNIDKEVTTLAETKIAYEAAIAALSKRGSIIKSAITDAR